MVYDSANEMASLLAYDYETDLLLACDLANEMASLLVYGYVLA